MTNLYRAVTKEELKNLLGVHCSPMGSREGYVVGPDVNGRLCQCASCFTMVEAKLRAKQLNRESRNI